MVSNIPSYASPQTSGKVKRSQLLGEMLREGMNRPTEAYRTGTATNLNMLSDIIRGYSSQKADREANEALHGDKTALADMLRGIYPTDAAGVAQSDLSAPEAYDLRPEAEAGRRDQANIGQQVQTYAQFGDPADALKFGNELQAQRRDEQRYEQKRHDDLSKPVTIAPGETAIRYDPDEDDFDEIFSVPARAGAEKGLQHVVGRNGNYWSFDPADGKMADTGIKAPPSSGGVTINMPGSVREGVGPDGRPAFVGINPGDDKFSVIEGATPPTTTMGAEGKSKFLSLAPQAYDALNKMRGLFQKGGDNPLEGIDDVAARFANALPIPGADVVARLVGGQNAQDFDQAWNTIEQGVHIPAGASVTPSEAQRFVRANRPAVGDSAATIQAKLNNVQKFYDGLAAGFRGDLTALDQLIPRASGQNQSDDDLDDEEQALVEELRRSGMSDAEIQKLISGP